MNARQPIALAQGKRREQSLAPPRRRFRFRREYYGLLFVLPAMLFFLIFSIYPMFSGLYYSLTRFTLLKPPVFVGLDNFTKLLADKQFQNAALVTFAFVVGTTVPQWILSLGLALLFRGNFRFKQAYKVLFFTPALLSGVVVSLVWKLLFDPRGLINVLIEPLAGTREVFWLGTSALAPYALMIVANWAEFGYLMLIWLAGLVSIPREFYDAAAIDGANRWQNFRHITLPLLKPTTVFVMVTTLIGTFQAFNLQFVMTEGGPKDSTTTMALLVYKNGFQYFKMGEAAAISVFMFLIIITITLLQVRIMRAEEVSYS
ncbi:MAG: sugar ABC transporter permease [Caldilineaceae bacterium]